jgi:FAD/FMN-containing dehydrogenase
MMEQTRRALLRTAAVAGAGAAGAGLGVTVAPASTAAAAPEGCEPTWPPPLGPATIPPDDPRYLEFVNRGINMRFVGAPDEVRVVGTTDHVIEAVQDGVRNDLRIAVRSGGHGFENFVDHPDVRMLIDMSGMTSVYYDPEFDAFAVEPGTTLGEVYRRLYLGWGVTIPAGWCPTVGAGGHVMGGGFGPLSRRFGLSVDYLYAVQVVVVDSDGDVSSVVATREADDPNRDLWWAHTGGGGGNFGIVTRYWFRAADAPRGAGPEELLPRPPATVTTFKATWAWDGMDQQAFSRLVTNYGAWVEGHSVPGTDYTALHSILILLPQLYGAPHMLLGQVALESGAERIVNQHLDAVAAGLPAPEIITDELPWLQAAFKGSGENAGRGYAKMKSAYARRRLTDQQVAAAYDRLANPSPDVIPAALSMATYGGQVNAVEPAATAYSHREALLKLEFVSIWAEADKEAPAVAGIRELYRDLYAETGGVPVPGEVNDGAYINYPDTDVADPEWNTSDVPWHDLYYKENYPQLQEIKGRWDPNNVFHHALSIQAPQQ